MVSKLLFSKPRKKFDLKIGEKKLFHFIVKCVILANFNFTCNNK
jgi:hypothetical protein